MKARPKLAEPQKAKAIAMARDGSTHVEIAALAAYDDPVHFAR